MSTKTLRKRISLVAVTALTAGVLSVVNAPAANANINEQSMIAISAGGGLKVATGANTTGATVVNANQTSSLSLGLLYKDASTTTAQTATMIAGGALVLIGNETAATSQAFSATGGTFSSPVGGGGTQTASTVEYGLGSTAILLKGDNATAVAVRWTTSTPGTYTLSLSVSTNTTNFTTLATRGDGTVRGNVTVTVVAASAGGSYSAANSACYRADSATAVAADSTTDLQDGASAYIQLNLNDAYGSDLPNGNLVATATNGGLISIGTGTQAVGTASTVVAYDNGASATDTYGTVRLSQPTAGKPLTSTVTVTYNGTVVCTKTVTISGSPDSLSIAFLGSGDLGTGTANAYWHINEVGAATPHRTAGHYLVLLKDSAGNIVNPASTDSFSADSATLTTTVTALTVPIASAATSTAYSATDIYSYTPGTFTCGDTAGSSKVKLKHTAASTGKIIVGEFTARCADGPATYKASFDKASYVQGEIATLTVSFFDSKGNPANSTNAIGALTETVSQMTRVTGVGDANTRAKADGTRTYKYTVGTSSGLTAGTYNGLIEFASLAALGGTTQTVTYKVSTGADTTTNADVLKSIVALIASINKQIQALQKLILKR